MKMVPDVACLLDQYMGGDVPRFQAVYPPDIEHHLGPEWYIFAAQGADKQRIYSSLDADLFTAMQGIWFAEAGSGESELAETILSNGAAVCWDGTETLTALASLQQAVELCGQQVGGQSVAPKLASYCQQSLTKLGDFCRDAVDRSPQWFLYFRS